MPLCPVEDTVRDATQCLSPVMQPPTRNWRSAGHWKAALRRRQKLSRHSPRIIAPRVEIPLGLALSEGRIERCPALSQRAGGLAGEATF